MTGEIIVGGVVSMFTALLAVLAWLCLTLIGTKLALVRLSDQIVPLVDEIKKIAVLEKELAALLEWKRTVKIGMRGSGN